MGMGDQSHATSRPLYPREWGPVPTVGTGWGPGAGLEVLEKKNNFVSVGIRTPPTVSPVASRWQTTLSPGCKQLHTRKQSNFLQSKYRGADKSLARPTSRCILSDGKNILYGASLIICINSTNIPPIMIINRIYETQYLLSL